MLYWSQNGNAITLGAWWWYLPPGLAVAFLGMGLVLLNFGLDDSVTLVCATRLVSGGSPGTCGVPPIRPPSYAIAIP